MAHATTTNKRLSMSSVGKRSLRKAPSMEQIEWGPEEQQTPIWKIVLTGGPCGGKTTALSIVADRLRSHGLQVFTVPENATLFSNAGAGFPVDSHKAHQLTWETSRMLSQMQMEDTFFQIALSSGKPTVIVMDRGVLDAKAYLDEESWDTTLAEMGWNEDAFLDRYDLVVHLVTTAVGARKHYVNTVYRHETPSEAAALDKKIQTVWRNHRCRHEIDNSTGYNDKVRRVIDSLCATGIGLTPQGDHSLVYELDPEVLRSSTDLPKCERIQTIGVILQNSTSEQYEIIRRRLQNSGEYYFWGRKSPDCWDERIITSSEFFDMLELAHPRLPAFELHKYVWIDPETSSLCELSSHPSLSYCLLELEPGKKNFCTDDLPSWIRPHVKSDVSSTWNLFTLVCNDDFFFFFFEFFFFQ